MRALYASWQRRASMAEGYHMHGLVPVGSMSIVRGRGQHAAVAMCAVSHAPAVDAPGGNDTDPNRQRHGSEGEYVAYQ